MTSNSVVVNRFSSHWEKHVMLKIVAFYTSFFSLGLSASVMGTTINSMEILLDTDTKSISAAFSGGSFGYLAGAIVCGFIYRILNKELLFAVALVGEGVMLAVAPFCGHLYLFVASWVLIGFCMSMIVTAGQSYLLKLLENHKYKEALTQGASAVSAFGATVGPFIIRPFLVDIHQFTTEQTNRTAGLLYNVNHNMSSIIGTRGVINVSDTLHVNSSINMYDDDFIPGFPVNNSVRNNDLKTDATNVRFAYVIIASVTIFSSVLFFVIFFLIGPSCCDIDSQREQNRKGMKHTKPYKHYMITLLGITGVLCFIYAWVEGIPSNYLAAFVVTELNWPNNYGALAISTFRGTHGIGRLVGVPVSLVLSPRAMIISDMAVTVCGFFILLFVSYVDFLLWIGVAIAGLGIGSISASSLLWLQSHIEITGTVSAVLISSVSLGGIIGPILAGYLFDEISPMCIVFILIAASIIQMFTFIGAHFYAQHYRKYDFHHEQINSNTTETQIS